MGAGPLLVIFLFLPFGYFLMPFRPEMLPWPGLMTVAGTAALAIAVAVGFRHGHRRLFWFGLSVGLSLALMGAVLLAPRSPAGSPEGAVAVGFMAAQVLLLGFLVVWLRGLRGPAMLVAFFCLTYAAYALVGAGSLLLMMRGGI
ncbi:MAG: hypothetical protein RIM84_07940 [Alphaproteobacteria bacterium]